MEKNRKLMKNLVDISVMVTQSTNFFEIKDKIVDKMLEVIEPTKACINLFYDKTPMNVAGIIINSGWITFLSLSIKILLTVVVSILLIATTGMENLACALRMIKVPKIFVMQILLTYRYISVLVEEASRMMKAYYLRAPGQKGVKMKDLGSFIGQMLLRTYDRAQRVYEAMKLRGFNGEYNSTASLKIKLSDYLYLTIWCLFFIVARNFNIPILIGNLFSGVIG